MSDPVSNIEIEDVLSSIRRLVAEGDAVKEEKKREYGDVSAMPERFVLTPALRVTEGTPTQKPTSSDSTLVLEPNRDIAETAFTPSQSDVNEDAQAALKEIFVGEPHAIPIDTIEADVDTTETPAAPAAELPTDTVSVSGQVSSRESLEATIAALEAAVDVDDDEFEPDGSEVKSEPSWESSGFNGFDSRRDDIENVDEAQVEDETGAAHELTNDIAVSETTAEGRVFKVVPDHAPASEILEDLSPEVYDVQADTVQDDTVRIQHTGFDKVIDQEAEVEDFGDDLIEDAAAPLAVDDDLSAAVSRDMVFDEEVMRGIVAEVLKGELEGKLGETITRNVRKLVRREINRVLSHQELE